MTTSPRPAPRFPVAKGSQPPRKKVIEPQSGRAQSKLSGRLARNCRRSRARSWASHGPCRIGNRSPVAGGIAVPDPLGNLGSL